jgi:type VI secretion system secreted protein VgrG
MLDGDFAFHWDGGGPEWRHLHVVRFTLEDAMSSPYELKLLLHAQSPGDEVDPFELLGKLGTLRIFTCTEPPVRSIHGVIVSAEDKGQSRAGSLYELVLHPPVARAMHRKRSRIFLEKTTKQIIEAVLKGDSKMQPGDVDGKGADDLRSAFTAPSEKFAWRLTDPSRIEDAKARPYSVQYEESDFDYVARLLEEEGISYHFEHTGAAVVLVMSDHDGGRHRLDPFEPLAPAMEGRQLDRVRLGGRIRPTKVKLVDYNWQKPKLAMDAEAKGDSDDLFVQAYPGRFVESPEQGAPLAKVMLERFQTEGRFGAAEGSCRLLGAGTIFKLQHPVSRYEGEYLVVKAILRGHAEGELAAGAGSAEKLPNNEPFQGEVEIVRRGAGDSVEESRFRPARRTPKPRILSTQTATVVDEPSARGVEIHVGGPPGNENGCVRLKFHWDTETERHGKEPASAWVRVSQVFAGAGGGAVAHPRVGTEVIVAYEDGDPDRPIIVGRVYNGVQPPAALGKGAATVSTMKSLSSPGGKVSNEFQFDDTAGKEKVNLTAGKDWNSNVGNNREETIANDSTSTVNANRKEETKVNRTSHVGANNEESVDGDEKVTITGRQTLTITSGQDQTVTADRNLTVTGPHSVTVGPETYTVNGAETMTVTAAKTETIGAAYTLSVGAAMTVNAAATHTLNTPIATTNAPLITDNSTMWTVSAGAMASINTTVLSAVAAGPATVQGATVSITAAGDVIISGASVQIKGGNISLEGGSIKIAGGTVDITGGVVKVN